MALSEFAARRAKPKVKPYKLSDGDGLHLLVNPTGSKLWRLKYRYGGKEKLLSFDPYPLISIADARQKRDEAKRTLLSGTDPSEAKRQQKIAGEVEARTTFAVHTTPSASGMRSRSVSTFDEMPSISRFNAPWRVGPLVLNTHRIWVVHSPDGKRNTRSSGHPCRIPCGGRLSGYSSLVTQSTSLTKQYLLHTRKYNATYAATTADQQRQQSPNANIL